MKCVLGFQFCST